MVYMYEVSGTNKFGRKDCIFRWHKACFMDLYQALWYGIYALVYPTTVWVSNQCCSFYGGFIGYLCDCIQENRCCEMVGTVPWIVGMEKCKRCRTNQVYYLSIAMVALLKIKKVNRKGK